MLAEAPQGRKQKVRSFFNSGRQCYGALTSEKCQEQFLSGDLSGLYPSGQPDRERRSAAGLAFDRDVSAHHLTEPFADDEPETGATIFARGAGRSLGKLLE